MAATMIAPGAFAAAGLPEPPSLGPVPIDFLLFAATLLGVALFHHHTLRVAVTGLAVISLFKVLFSPFVEGSGVGGLVMHLGHEWVLIFNLLGLLLGFALLSKHFEASRVPAILPDYLPNDWKGGFVLLIMIFVLSSFLDNIAAALIGGTIAAVVFRRKLHIGYLAALEAYAGAVVARVLFGIPASLQQQKFPPIVNFRPSLKTRVPMFTSNGCGWVSWPSSWSPRSR